MRQIQELIDDSDPGVLLLREWAQMEGACAKIFDADPALAKATLLRLQITTRSILGAVAYETGGISARNGLIRILGSGADRSLHALNDQIGGMRGGGDDFILIADDAFGGLFALNGGRFGKESLGSVHQLAAYQLTWEDLGAGYSDFIYWCLTGDFHSFYEPFHNLAAWNAERPAFSEAFSFYPFLWTVEGRDGAPDCRTIDADESARFRIETSGFDLA